MPRILFALFIGLIAPITAQAMEVASGTLTTIKDFQSAHVPARDVHIWLPDGYSDKEKYAVLYMHDGLMLFDAKTTWNKQAWDVDDVAGKLMAEGKVRDFIIVGINNGDALRFVEYYPQKPFESMPQKLQNTYNKSIKRNGGKGFTGSIRSDNYLRFLVEELKPYIDANYSVHTDRANTAIMGSSMGGLISIYAISEYPETFGAAACISTHWIGFGPEKNNPSAKAFAEYLSDHLPDPDTHRIYFDLGDQTLDQHYPKHQDTIDVVMKARGYDETNWMTKHFPGHRHDEISWNARLHIPLEFIFGAQAQ